MAQVIVFLKMLASAMTVVVPLVMAIGNQIKKLVVWAKGLFKRGERRRSELQGGEGGN